MSLETGNGLKLHNLIVKISTSAYDMHKTTFKTNSSNKIKKEFITDPRPKYQDCCALDCATVKDLTISIN